MKFIITNHAHKRLKARKIPTPRYKKLVKLKGLVKDRISFFIDFREGFLYLTNKRPREHYNVYICKPTSKLGLFVLITAIKIKNESYLN